MPFRDLFMSQWWPFFWEVICKGAIGNNPFLLGLLLLLAAVLFFGLGASVGLPRLFWHDSWWRQMLAGGAVALLVAKVLFFSYLLDSQNTVLHSKWVAGLPPGANPLYFYLAHGALVAAAITLACAIIMGLLNPGRILRTNYLRFGLPFLIGLLGGSAFVYFVGQGLLWIAYRPWGGYDAPGSIPPHGIHVIWQAIAPGEIWGGDTALFILAALITLLLVAEYLANVFSDVGGTPATGLCNILGMAAMVYTYLIYRHFNPTLLLLFVFAWMLLTGWQRYKLRFDGLRSRPRATPVFDYYQRDQLVSKFADPAKEPVPAPIDRAAVPGKKQPLVVVCVSGGGIRSSVWTVRMLAELERQLPGFPECVRLITGSSGGMVGAAYYCATLKPPGEKTADQQPNWNHTVSADEMIGNMGKDTLSPVVKRLLFWDLLFFFLPFVRNVLDRGQVLERAWNKNLASKPAPSNPAPATRPLEQTFDDLRQGEEQGWRPSLVFSPMMVEDGRRLLITNAQTEFLTTSSGNYISDKEYLTRNDVYSRSAFTFFRLFPKASATFTLATAARMNASFPYITPAGVLPTTPRRRRIVDAGYFDNYGGDLAAGWLAHWLTPEALDSVSGVLLVEIRDGVDELSGDTDSSSLFKDPAPAGFYKRAFDEIDAPPVALLSARVSVSLFRNDTKLDWLMKRFSEARKEQGVDPNTDDFFVPVLLEFEGKASLSLYLSDEEKRNLDVCSKSEEITKKLEHLKHWWEKHA